MNGIQFTLQLLIWGFISGYITKLVIKKKEKQRFRQSQAMGREVWMPRLNSFHLAYRSGVIIFASSIFLFLGIPYLGNNCSWAAIFVTLFGFLLLVIFFSTFLIQISVFAIVDDTFVMWRLCGFGRIKKFALNDLTRTERNVYLGRYYGRCWVIELWQGEKRFLKIRTKDYDEMKALVEHLLTIKSKN